MIWRPYNKDKDATVLEAGTYLCRCVYPDERLRYKVKTFTVFGNTFKRGYFATAANSYIITHTTTIKPLSDDNIIED